MPSRFGIRQKLEVLIGKPVKSREPSPRPPSVRSNLSSTPPALDSTGGAESTPAINLPDPQCELPPTSATANATPDSASHYSVLATEPPPSATATNGAPGDGRLPTASTASVTLVAEPQSKDHPSLWEVASDSSHLSPKQRQILSETCLGKDVSLIASDIGDITTRIKQQREGKEWKVPFREDVVIMKDIVTKTLRWVHKFREIGDIIAQYDSQHAALPWGAFRFLLKVNISSLPLQRDSRPDENLQRFAWTSQTRWTPS